MKVGKIITAIILCIVILASVMGGALADRLFVIKPLDLILKRPEVKSIIQPLSSSGEQALVEIAERASNSVVTVAIVKREQPQSNFYDPFGFFGFSMPQPSQGMGKQVNQDIGSGFVVEKEGIIVTNKHVVADTTGKYKVITKDSKEYDVEKIYRDPANDLALLKIAANLEPMDLGDSTTLKVGQSVIAIGTALGEFRHTVTTGVISGLGRGIEAGDGFRAAERLDGVIQTDAAINPGNSGGPLLNSRGEVIGVNVAVAAGAQNIGFALPINVIKDSLKQFDATGKFSRPYVGLRYKIISKNVALLNDTVAGAYIVELLDGSPAQKAGLKVGDTVTRIEGEEVATDDSAWLSKIIAKHKVGDILKFEFVRDNKKEEVNVMLSESGE